jgi:hypothetical protein
MASLQVFPQLLLLFLFISVLLTCPFLSISHHSVYFISLINIANDQLIYLVIAIVPLSQIAPEMFEAFRK